METFFRPFDGILSGSGVFERTSPYSDKMGKSVAASVITIYSDPKHAASLRSQSFDAEGTPSRKVILVENGVFRTPLTNARWSKKLKIENTASAQRTDPHAGVGLGFTNFVVAAGTASFQSMLNKAPNLLLVDELEGMAGFNRSTGNFSIPCVRIFGRKWQGGHSRRQLRHRRKYFRFSVPSSRSR